MAESIVALATALMALAYVSGVRRLWTRTGGRRLVRAANVTAFAAGIAALLVATSPPLHDAADQDLVWHMVQHVLLLSVAAPLLALGAPLTAMLYALPTEARLTLQPAWRRLLRSQGERHWPLWFAASGLVAASTLVAWHVPVAYDAAVRDPWTHAAEHVTFVVSAALFWWIALGAGRRARRGVATIGVFVATFPPTVLGLLMTVSTTSWYSVYGNGPTAVRDQRVAGAVMWGFGGVATTVAAVALFAGWLAGLERADQRRAEPHAAVGRAC